MTGREFTTCSTLPERPKRSLPVAPARTSIMTVYSPSLW